VPDLEEASQREGQRRHDHEHADDRSHQERRPTQHFKQGSSRRFQPVAKNRADDADLKAEHHKLFQVHDLNLELEHERSLEDRVQLVLSRVGRTDHKLGSAR
jgi:hypothetical protein